jgi:hypothetical protein
LTRITTDGHDNAAIEAFFSSLKSELADRFESCVEVKMELFDYLTPAANPFAVNVIGIPSNRVRIARICGWAASSVGARASPATQMAVASPSAAVALGPITATSTRVLALAPVRGSKIW